jgi:hypothetical protein
MHRCEHGDCGYDYNRTWDYECHKEHRRDRRFQRRLQGAWDYSGW